MPKRNFYYSPHPFFRYNPSDRYWPTDKKCRLFPGFIQTGGSVQKEEYLAIHQTTNVALLLLTRGGDRSDGRQFSEGGQECIVKHLIWYFSTDKNWRLAAGVTLLLMTGGGGCSLGSLQRWALGRMNIWPFIKQLMWHVTVPRKNDRCLLYTSAAADE